MGNVFNRYGAGGGKSEGLYIWKKYEYKPAVNLVNPTITFDASKSAFYKITSEDIDLSMLPDVTSGNASTSLLATMSEDAKTVIDFLDGFETVGANYYRLYKYNNALRITDNSYTYEAYRYAYSDSSNAGYIYRVTTTSYYHAGTSTLQYNGTKTLPAKIGDMVGYVVSDKEDEYPDGAEKGGYYYEKVKYDSSMFGGDKVVAGTITPTSNARSISISNTVGTIPKLLMIESENQSSYFNYGLWIFDNTGVNGVTGYCSGSTGYSSSASGTANATTITPMVRNTASHYFQANTKLAYVVVY